MKTVFTSTELVEVVVQCHATGKAITVQIAPRVGGEAHVNVYDMDNPVDDLVVIWSEVDSHKLPVNPTREQFLAAPTEAIRMWAQVNDPNGTYDFDEWDGSAVSREDLIEWLFESFGWESK